MKSLLMLSICMMFKAGNAFGQQGKAIVIDARDDKARVDAGKDKDTKKETITKKTEIKNDGTRKVKKTKKVKKVES
jgi:hypothetical protein